MLIEERLASKISIKSYGHDEYSNLQLFIMSDDIEMFQKIAKNQNFSFSMEICFRRRIKGFKLFSENYELLKFICMCGSLKCFKFALLNLQINHCFLRILKQC